MNPIRIRLCIAFILALALSILPLPAFLIGFRPPWVLLFCLYLVFYKPESLHLGILFCLGLVLDVLLSTVMGEHAFSLLLVTWLAASKRRRFSHFPMGHQMIVMGFLCCAYQFTLFFIDLSFGYSTSFLPIILSTGLAMVLWPWIRLFAEDVFISRLKQKAF